MTEFSFNQTGKSNAEVKIILASGSNFRSGKFISEDEVAALKNAAKKQNFEGKNGTFAEINNGKKQIILAGIGNKSTSLSQQILGGKIYKKICNSTNAAIYIPTDKKNQLSLTETACNIALGIELGGYRFDKYFTKKSADSYPKLEKIDFYGEEKIDESKYPAYQALASSVRYARDLCNEPANNLTPEIYADDIERLDYLNIDITVLEEDKIHDLGMDMLLSVAQGSVNAPRVAVLQWKGNKDSKEFDIGLVGKGVTFDSGGISLKPSANMGDMKGDMTGSAVVVASIKAAALQKLPLNIVGVVGLVENMPSGSATRPGDVVKSMSGQTVEVVNTDAEGRLVLGDCLWYIQEKFGVKRIIDIATLTGSTMMTFGFEYAGLFSNDDKLSADLLKAGEQTGEKLWRLPINADYDKMIDSDIADIKNCGPRLAGGITAACFLQRFIQDGTKWAHLDIAGVDRDEKGHPLTPKGATAFGVRVLNQFLRHMK